MNELLEEPLLPASSAASQAQGVEPQFRRAPSSDDGFSSIERVDGRPLPTGSMPPLIAEPDAPQGPRSPAAEPSGYFASFGARMRRAGFFKALFGGGRQAPAPDPRAGRRAIENYARHRPNGMFSRLFAPKAPQPWMAPNRWNAAPYKAAVGRGAGHRAGERTWTDDANLQANPALGVGRGTVEVWGQHLEQAHAVREAHRRGGADAGDQQVELFKNVMAGYAAQGSSQKSALRRARAALPMMLNQTPRAKREEDPAEGESFVKGGMIDGIPVVPHAPSADFEGDLPPAVRAVFGEINPHADDGGTGYAEADMRVRFPGIQPGVKPLPNGPGHESSDSERLLTLYQQEQEMYGDDEEQLSPEDLLKN